MANESKSESIGGCTMYTWNMSRAPIRLRLTRPGILAAMSLVLVGCTITMPPPDQLWAIIQTCSMSWGAEASTSLTAKYEDLRKGGEVEWKAAVEAGGTLLKHFKDEAKGLEAYDKYLQCVKPAIDKFVSADQRPAVVLVGSKEDYTDYRLSELEATSVELLHKRLGITFKVLPLTVSYGWDNEESIRTEKPAVIVMHASAFHHDQHKDEAVEKFQAIVSSLYGLPNTKFLVFSRLPPENPPPDLCQRWNHQVNFLRAEKFQDRLVFYPLHREDSNFTGKAGIEISQIIRCLSGLDATEYSKVYLREIKKEAQQRIANSSCNGS